MPKISIVLPVYNGEKYIRESLDSILEQSFQDWELIIVNDCSTDNTAQIVNQYSENNTRIRVIHNKVNQKLPKSLNIGFSYANGDYFTWTSDDNVYKKDALKVMYEYICSHPNCAMVRTDMDIINEDSTVIGSSPTYIAENIFYENQVGACFLYKREVMDKVGGYDIDLFGVEDYEYWLRIVKNFGFIENIPKNLYRYRRHSCSLSNQKKVMIDQKRAEMRIRYIDFILENIALEMQIFYIYDELVKVGLDTEIIRKKFYSYLPELEGIVHWDKKNQNIIYGAGDFGNKALELVRENVLFYVDSAPEKQGKIINGLNVYGIEVLKNMEYDHNLILALSREKLLNVMRYLRSNGINKYVIFQHLSKVI